MGAPPTPVAKPPLPAFPPLPSAATMPPVPMLAPAPVSVLGPMPDSPSSPLSKRPAHPISIETTTQHVLTLHIAPRPRYSMPENSTGVLDRHDNCAFRAERVLADRKTYDGVKAPGLSSRVRPSCGPRHARRGPTHLISIKRQPAQLAGRFGSASSHCSPCSCWTVPSPQ